MRALRAALPAVALQLAIFLLATVAHGQVIRESDGIHHFPGRTWIGPEVCGTADTRQGGHSDGTCAYFTDAVAGSQPMTCPGGAGAVCCHQHGEWDCFGEGATTTAAPTTTTASTSTTTTTTSTTTTTTSAGGICTPDTAVPLEQRAIRTVATSGTCQANFLPFCDVRNYGAKGDGTTDDSAAFAAAIAACCTGGTVYAPRTPTAPSFYKVVHGFNNDESCSFNLLGDGATPNGEASAIHLTTAINTNCVTGPPRTCDALFDLNGGWAQDVALQGPNAFAVNPGVDNENSDGLHNVSYATRVEVKRFTTALQFPNVIRDSTITNDYIGAVSPREIWRSEFNAQNYAGLYFDGAASNVSSWYSTYGESPYLWISTNGASSVLSEFDAFTAYGNAGISFAGAHAVNQIRIKTHGSFTSGQSNVYKLPAVGVDKALHLGIVGGDNLITASDDLINQANHCLIDDLTTGVVRYIMTNAPAVEISGTCTLTAGSNASFTVCNADETQCMPQAIAALGTGGALSPSEGAAIYFVPTSATDVQEITPTAGACSHFIGQRYTLIFTGTRKLKHEAVGTGCEMALQGGLDFSGAAGNTITLLHDGTRWREVARSTPPP